MLSRPYWHRLWIIQEIGLAKQAVVLAGDRNVDLEELTNVAVEELTGGTFLHSLSELRKQGNILDPEGRKPTDAEKKHLTTKESKLEDRWLNSGNIWGRMSAFGSHLCEDPRDKIFGVISLFTDENPIEVDYGKTLGELVSQLLYTLAQRHADIFEKEKTSSHALPLSLFRKMLEFASRAATISSFGADDLVDFKQPTGYELCCEIKSMETEMYGRIVPGFFWNVELCEFREWGNLRSCRHRMRLLPSPPHHWYDPIITNNDTNFYHISYDRSSNKQICYYPGDREPDPIRYRFFKIDPMDSVLSRTSSYPQSDVYVDQVMLLVEFGKQGPKVAGVMADADWWDMLFKPSDIMGVPRFMTNVEILAMFLLEGEIQICSEVALSERKSWYDGKMELRLHYSRLASMVMLITGSAGLTQPEICKALKKWRTLRSRPHLCSCEHEAEDMAKVCQLVRNTNMNEIRSCLKRDMGEMQKKIATQYNIFQKTQNAKSWAGFPQGIGLWNLYQLSHSNLSRNRLSRGIEITAIPTLSLRSIHVGLNVGDMMRLTGFDPEIGYYLLARIVDMNGSVD